MTQVARLFYEEATEKRSIEIAKKMLIAGEPMRRIMEYTDLSIEELEKLQSELALIPA
ncbi:MAG: hypothetical protein FWG87_07240 [Defluviitaleaceae bacterium]|nr:hypothetical protein [Defluviitaleaceae bacterium]